MKLIQTWRRIKHLVQSLTRTAHTVAQEYTDLAASISRTMLVDALASLVLRLTLIRSIGVTVSESVHALVATNTVTLLAVGITADTLVSERATTDGRTVVMDIVA